MHSVQEPQPLMKVAIIAVYTDNHRRGRHFRSLLQPQIGPLLAALLPDDAEVEVIQDTWTDPDWQKDYDLVFLSCMHSDFDRARQISHYYRRRGALTVLGGSMASAYPHLCVPWFDAVAVGDPEQTVPRIYEDACARKLKQVYRSPRYRADLVPTPRIALSAAQQVAPLALEATRGCTFTCDFCALTAAGTRFEMRDVDKVVRDIRLIRQALQGIQHQGGFGTRALAYFQKRLLVFYDNNLGGNLGYLRRLCDAIEPLGIHWAGCVTFNVLTRRDLLKRMYDSGCRTVFVGLESFNPAALAGFNKPQNRLSQVRQAFDTARAEGIVVTAGLMLSPVHDDVAYIRALPCHLRDSGLHMPSFVCFETAIPGTPLFYRMAGAAQPAFMPDAALHDFNAYSLVLQPRKATTEDFLGAYREVMDEVFSASCKARKLADDLPRLLGRGSWGGAALDVVSTVATRTPVAPGRTFVPQTDILPPERVPLVAEDFASEAEFHTMTRPTRVTDGEGRVLPQWTSHSVAFAT